MPADTPVQVRNRLASAPGGGKGGYAVEETARAAAVSSPQAIVAKILRGLYAGRYVAGQRLIEADLTREYKVSRGSIREALKLLAAEGVVTLTLHRGAYIRALSRSETKDVFAIIETLTALAARLAAQHIHENDGAAIMRDAIAQIVAAARGDFLDFAQARNGFYRRLVRIGGNRELDRMLPTMHVHLVRTQFRRQGALGGEQRVEEYERIVAALLKGDAEASEAATREHVRGTAERIDRLPDDAFGPENADAARKTKPRGERLF